MFTVIIESGDLLRKSVREWPTVDIYSRGDEQFDLFMKHEMVRLGPVGGHTDEVVGSYKAVIKSACGEFEYYVVDDESVYITNSSGKTVASVR